MQSTAVSFDLVSGTWNASTLPTLDSPRTLVMAFGAPELIDEPGAIEMLARAYPRSLLVGCSSAGEIHGTSIRDRSLAVTVTRFDKTDLQLASLEVKSSADSYSAGAQLAKRLAAKPGLRGVLVLSEGLNVNGSELIRGLNSVLDESIVVTGGLSGDGANFKRTWVAVGAKVRPNIVAAVGFYGDHVIIGHGSKGGWDKFGPERVVTKSDGNVLYELDGKPALQLYKEYLGDKAKDLPASGLLFPLSLRATNRDDKFVVRTLLSVDHAQNSLTFAGDIPRGHLAQLMKADFDRLIDGAGTAGSMTSETGTPPADQDALVVAISCVGRRLVLGARTEEEVEAVRNAVSERANITGFYSYGEISPYATGHCDLHNQTMTLTVFSESAQPIARGSRPAIEMDAESTNTAVSAPPRPQGFTVASVSYDHAKSAWSGRLPPLDSPRTLVLGFGTPELADNPMAFGELARAYPRSLVIGCSSAGEIHGTTVRDRSLAVTVTRFDKTDLQLASLEVRAASDSFSAGQQLAKRLVAKPGLRGVLVLSEGLNVNGSELIRGLNDVLDSSIVVTGGLSGDGANFKRTWVAVGAKVRSNVVAAVGFYGDHVVIGHGSKGGWDKFGPERVVTKSEGNVLYELDGKPALQLYKEYLGDKAKELPASGLLFPLSLRAAGGDDKFVVRTLLAVDHAKNSLTFAGDIPRGHHAQLMKADFDRLIHGAGAAGSMTSETGTPPPNTDSLVVAISCVGRRLVLGSRIEEEVEAVRDAVSSRAHITGFYSYGEISPYATGHCDLHNQTMTLTVFSESPTPLQRGVKPTPAAKAAVIAAPRATSPRIVIPPPGTSPPRSTKASGTQRAQVPPGFAVREALYDLQKKTWQQKLPDIDSPRTLLLGFGAPELLDDPTVFAELARDFPQSTIVACSTAGEIYGTSVRDHSLALTATRFEKTDLQLASIEVKTAADSHSAGSLLAAKLAAKAGLRAVLVLSEGLNVNGSELIRGLNSVLDESIVVTGGLSGDGANFKRTWVAIGGSVRSNVVAAVGFYGDHIVVGHGSKGGWDKFGPERIVTKAEGNVLYELDGKPALQLYKEYLGDKAKDLPASGLLFPLSLRAAGGDDKFVVRTLLAVDHAKNSLTFAGDIPRGYHAQLMKADFDRLIDGAGVAGAMTAETGARLANADSLVVAISCVGRRLVLGSRIEEEVEAVRDSIRSERARITGFYSYGEISPYATGHCDLHNQTMTLTVFSESPTPIAKKTEKPRVATPRAATPPPPPRPTPVPAPAPLPAAVAPTGPIVRVPRPLGNEATVETSSYGAIQLVKIRGRITESFKGDQVGRTLSGRVVFDLADVDRVTSFGVREWLAMLASASAVTESTFVRCSESIVNQLTMIRKFDGGARIASFFAPYLCSGCGNQVERLLDCERDAADLAVHAPGPVSCPRCDAEARFDDDPRSYFAFASSSIGVVLPADVRAIHDSLIAQVATPSTDEVEKIVDDASTRIRVQVKLTGQIRWRKILDGIEGALTIDLGAIPASEPSGVNNLEQALRVLPPEVKPIEIEAAPASLIERILQGGNRRVRVVSAVVTGYCDSCAVNRPATVRIDQYANDAAAGLAHQVVCKRCNGNLALTLDESFKKVVEIHQRPTRKPTNVPVEAPVPGVTPEPKRRGVSWVAASLIVLLATAVGALGVMVYLGQRATKPTEAAPAPVQVVAPAVSIDAGVPAEAPPPPPKAGWQDTADLPPAWVERMFAIDGATVFVVGRGAPGATAEAALESARTDATMRLVDQLFDELAGTPVHAFVSKRVRRDAPGATQSVVERFVRQHAKDIAFERAEATTRKVADGFETYVRYKLPKAQFEQLIATYKTTTRFRGFELAHFFPLLETALHTSGELIVTGVDKRGAADAAGIHEGDIVLQVGATPVQSVETFRTTALAAWSRPEPRKLTFEIESAGAARTVTMYKPAL